MHVHEPVLVIDDHATRALAGERDDRVGLLQTWHERLLAQHVRTGLQGVAHQCEMRVGRRGDDDDIGSGCPQQRRKIRKERKAEVGVRRNRIRATDDRDPIERGQRGYVDVASGTAEARDCDSIGLRAKRRRYHGVRIQTFLLR